MLNLGTESQITANGKTYTVAKLQASAVLFAWRDWIADVEDCPPPSFTRKIDPQFFALMTTEEQKEWFTRSQFLRKQLKGFSLQCALAKEYLSNESALAKLAQLLLRKHHPDITEQEALEVAECDPAKFSEALHAAQGEAPAGPPNADSPAPLAKMPAWSIGNG